MTPELAALLLLAVAFCIGLYVRSQIMPSGYLMVIAASFAVAAGVLLVIDLFW